MQRFSNHGNYVIATSVHASAGKPFVASFSIRKRIDGGDEQMIHTERLERTFAFGEEARAAATRAAQIYIDSLSRHP